jgi:hypothetical protein
VHLERVGDHSIFNLVSAAISASHKYFVFDIETPGGDHEDWYRFDFNGFGNGHQGFVDDYHLVIFGTHHWEALRLFVFKRLEDLCEASDEVSVAKSCATSDVGFV